MITQMNTMLSSEVWQDIQGYSGIYQVATLTDAQTITGIAYQNIRACCIGRYKTAGNYIWKFNK